MSDSCEPAEHIQHLAKQANKAAREFAAVSGEAKAAAHLYWESPSTDIPQ